MSYCFHFWSSHPVPGNIDWNEKRKCLIHENTRKYKKDERHQADGKTTSQYMQAVTSGMDI